tara:strand:+ start:82 stop:378 length:297 start_codon:yes stop_codon:yes gene_type:complete
MTLTRYRQSSLIDNNRAIGTNMARVAIHDAAQSGAISTDIYITKQGDRLDKIAGERYGDGTLWWVIAAASGIGWWLQIPSGVVLTIPTSIEQVNNLVS